MCVSTMIFKISFNVYLRLGHSSHLSGLPRRPQNLKGTVEFLLLYRARQVTNDKSNSKTVLTSSGQLWGHGKRLPSVNMRTSRVTVIWP